MDTDVANIINGTVGKSAAEGMAMIGMIDRNLGQGLGVINDNLIHQHGGVADDAGLIAALQTASGAPRQGHVSGT